MKNIALITGASSGIWLELAHIHAEKWWDLILVARSKDKLEAVKKELEAAHKIRVLCIVKDLSDPRAAKELYDEVKKQEIEIDYLINNAGFGGQGFFHERKWEDDKNMIQLNIMTLVELSRYFVEDMVQRGSWKILQVSSTASFMPGPLQAVYFASKSFVQFFSNALSRELQGTGVTVTNLMPGATETGFEKAAWLDETDLFSQTVPARWVAQDWYDAMISGKMDVISGLTFGQKILMKLLPFIPKKTMLNMVFNMQKKTK